MFKVRTEENEDKKSSARKEETKMLQSPPVLTARNDSGVNSSLIYLYLYRCGVHQQHIKVLHDFVKSEGLKLTLAGLDEVLELLDDNEKIKGVGNGIKTFLQHSGIDP